MCKSLYKLKVSILRKILVFGNSGSGKSTLSKRLSADEYLAHLDLDTLAFRKESPTERRDIEETLKDVFLFLEDNDDWVIEGGYADIFEKILSHANEMIYLDLSVKNCQENARNRKWEPHKYQSKEAQDKNLDMLINWISDYNSRDDSFSASAHNRIFDQFPGNKKRFTSNQTIT